MADPKDDVPEQKRDPLARSIAGRAYAIARIAEAVVAQPYRKHMSRACIKTLDGIDCDLERLRSRLEYLREGGFDG